MVSSRQFCLSIKIIFNWCTLCYENNNAYLKHNLLSKRVYYSSYNTIAIYDSITSFYFTYIP